FNIDSKFKPFLMAGIGHMRSDAGVLEDDTLASTLGAGIKYDLSPNWRFRTDARWHYADKGHNDLYSVTMGLAYVIGNGTTSRSTAATAAAATAAAAATQASKPDSDGDGVADADDLCPNTPAGVKV